MTKSQLCPGLVVPRSTECILAVPIRRRAWQQEEHFEVKDYTGRAVVNCCVCKPQRLMEKPAITLRAAAAEADGSGNSLLAYCKVQMDEARSLKPTASLTWMRLRCVEIYNAQGVYFGRFTRHPQRDDCFALTSPRAAVNLCFTGQAHTHNIEITENFYPHHKVAYTKPETVPFDPHGEYFKLRVAADLDVGLLLCGLLAMEVLVMPGV